MQLAPFRHRIFRDLWIASLVSNFGGLIQSVGASWLMTSLDASPGLISLVQAANTLPIMFFSLLAGAIADNFDRRLLMLASQAFLLVVSTVLAVFSYLGWITPASLLAFTFLVGCGTAFNGPAWQSLVGEMVPRIEIPAAIALNSAGFNIARSAGPALGGFIVATAGAFTAFAVNAVSYVGLIAVLARWKPPAPPRLLPPEALGSAMAAGIRYVFMSPRIGVVMLRGAVFGLAGIAVQALMPLIARDLVHGGPLTFGLLLGGFGVGAVGGAFLGGDLRRRAVPAERIVQIAFAGSALCAAISAVSGSAAVTILAMAIGGGSWVLALAGFNASVQLSAPRWVLGRALALYQVTTFGGMALGSWLWGLLAEQASTETALLGSAVALVAGVALGLWLPVPDIEPVNLDPRKWDEPMVALDIRPRSGPIVVTIEYDIRQEDVVDFLAAMASRRRIRLRDGARHWTLLRDLAEPSLWVERYHSPTWHDYIRHNLRLTQADLAISKTLLALHQGPDPPKVRRMIERQTTWMSAVEHPMEDHLPSLRDVRGDALG